MRDRRAERRITISTSTIPKSLPIEDFRALVRRHLDGLAAEADVAVLTAHQDLWIDVLETLLDEAAESLDHVRRTVQGPERELVVADFAAEFWRIEDLLVELTGESSVEPAEPAEPAEPVAAVEADVDPALQLSWSRGHVVAWYAGSKGDGADADTVADRLVDAGASRSVWRPHDAVRLPHGATAEALHAPIESSLGWLVGLGCGEPDRSLGASANWLGLIAALAVRLAAQGRMVPQLEKVGGGNQSRTAGFAVRWAPALIDPDELDALAAAMPGAAAVLGGPREPKLFIQGVVGDFLDVLCRDAAAKIEVPAPPPDPRSEQEVAEALLARLDGEEFEAPDQRGVELARALRKWARPVTTPAPFRLVVQLDPPDASDGWLLRALVPMDRGQLKRAEAAMAKASESRRQIIKTELDRLETLYAPLMRGRSSRRGDVILSQDEAWEFMTSDGAVLATAGFDVRVPPLSRRKPRPSLRLTSTDAQETVVGAQQLTTVAWSAVFDDVELTVEDIRRLATEARPLVKAHGKWIELDHADLQAAAAALEERADRTRMTGAEMLRHALGLDGSPLPGGFDVAGRSWAADLLRSAAEISEHHTTTPEGFRGELRSYQADALAWLGFLESAGLGGILALDMGLGKTPVMLAHLRQAVRNGPALVVAPPAVVGNWAAEAQKFVPGLRVLVHHGAMRAEKAEIAAEVARADVIITTYGTAVRDISALEAIEWGTLVLDEAQVIKNPASDTAQQLRRVQARTKVALTGTPIENGLGDLWALLDFTNPGLVGDRASFVAQLSRSGGGRSSAEAALRTLNGVLVFRRTKSEPAIAAELPDRIDVLDHCPMTPEQIGLYQAVLDNLVADTADDDAPPKKGAVLAAITALKQICNHPAAYNDDDGPLEGRSGKLARLDEIVDNVFEAQERVLIFTHFAQWGEKVAAYLTRRTGVKIACYHGGLARGTRDRIVREFQEGTGAGALVLSLKAGGTGLNLTAASHVVLYDRWWNPAVEDQARDRAWRIGQRNKVVAHRLVCPGTVDERVEEVVAGKRRIADLVLPASSSVDDLRGDQLRAALGIDPETVLADETFQPTPEGAVA
ncbi:MAG TPA: DEAD/DEAH box helicase [Egibacteraceae bacterium]|nr:DEAD/DEAH box helicase [Egibacteraceae bacterium]